MIPISSLLTEEPTSQNDAIGPPSLCNFRLLPPEIRLKIWSCAVEPRVLLVADLMQKPSSYPLPAVAQLNAEAREVARPGYEAVGQGSYVHFSRDMLLCDHAFTEQRSNPMLEKLAPRIERAIFWDCIPDERVRRPDDYSTYLSTCYGQHQPGHVSFEKLWFPNLIEYWFIKVGEVDRAWMVSPDRAASFDDRVQQMAQEFDYWVDEDIIEMSSLDLGDPGAQTVLRHGRCSLDNCRVLNHGRNHIVSKVNFRDGPYQEPEDERKRIRISTMAEIERTGCEAAATSTAAANYMRWALVERSLTFMLHHDWSCSRTLPGTKREPKRGGACAGSMTQVHS